MKNLYFFLLFSFSFFYISAQNQPFITTWDATANRTITVPTHPGSTYNYTVDFGDGTVLSNQTGDVSHTYLPGVYTVTINGTFPRIYFDHNYNGDIVSVEQWGNIQWTSMESAFEGCYNLVINAIDAPDLSQVTDMSFMFRNCNNLNQSIDHWDVSNITDMSYMFYQASSFNQSLNNWDVSSVVDMERVFGFAEDFDQPLNNWDVSSVVNMEAMFVNASSFNSSISTWNVSSVTSMYKMFTEAIFFDQPLNNWDVSSVNNMRLMFSSATSFNQPLNNWDVSNVNTIHGMFQNASNFDQNLNNWDVSNVTEMTSTFHNASSYNQPLNNWNITAPSLFDFLNNSGLSVRHYDNFLSQLVALGAHQINLGAQGLEYCNTTIRNELINRGWNITGDTQSQNCNSIVGEITYDENNNGCDPTDIGVSGFLVDATDGVENWQTFTLNGNYELGVIGNNFTVSVMNMPTYYSITPANQQVTFTTSNSQTADFCVTANQSVDDLNITLIPRGGARPGFNADYQLVVENLGTQAVTNATVTLDFDNTMQSFVNSSAAPTSTTANQLTFDIANLQPLTFQTVDITMQTFQPPTVNGDDILSFTANVNPSANDFTPSDNTFIYDQTVVNSYDPNDKQVLQGEEIEIDKADEYLNYLIRFQNTGTASAINVRILDTLHPKLDYSTLRPVNASHNYRIEVNNKNEVEFIFDGINLPDENTNEPASHGFVAYKIKPKSDVAVEDFITGDANIYFDFNAPIITNMVSTKIIDDLSSTNYELENNISIYPNPAKNILHIEAKNKQKIEQLKIYNLSGLELMNVEENKQLLNLESLSTGVYFIQIQTNLGTVNKRFIKN
jgi:surface protein